MCGRFAFYSPAEAVAQLFGAAQRAEFSPRYNVAPTQDIAAIRTTDEGGLELTALRWGLVPFWAKDPGIGNRMINARSETVAEKPAFRAAFARRRCAILADGFYEWRKEGDGKTPYFISRSDGAPLAFAGLWEDWTDKETGENLQTATILTRAANDFMEGLHLRMPVILDAGSAPAWFDTSAKDILTDDTLTAPALQAWPVSRRVNRPANDDESLIEPTGEPYDP